MSSDGETDFAERFKRTIERRDRAIGTQRIGDLNRLFACRYGGNRESYVFPDDDAGLEDLKIGCSGACSANSRPALMCSARSAVARSRRRASTPSLCGSASVPACRSRSILTCSGTAAAMPWRTPGTTRGPSRPGWVTRTSSTRCATPNWRRIGSTTSGGIDLSGGLRAAFRLAQGPAKLGS
jgi:hypothetical protein